MEIFYHLTLPGDETFDAERVVSLFLRNRCAFRLPHATVETVVVSSTPEAADRLRELLSANPLLPYDTQGVVQVRPGYLTVRQMAPVEILEQLERVVVPLIRERSCRITGEYGDDLTEKYRDHPEKLFRD